MINSLYFKQAELLLRIIPLIDREAVFALKGGTAIISLPGIFPVSPSILTLCIRQSFYEMPNSQSGKSTHKADLCSIKRVLLIRRPK
jgi:hypothetical protein